MPDRHRPRHTATSPRSKPRNKPKQHSGHLWQPAYFTVLGDYRSVVADTEADLDINPDLAPITATVTFTPVLASGDAIRASKADPRPTIYVPVPIVGHISADGRLKLRDAPAGRLENHESLSVLPTAGADGVAYMTVDDQRVWRWNGTTYIEDYNYTPIRLLADTALLELSSPLYYHVTFTDVRFNGELGIPVADHVRRTTKRRSAESGQRHPPDRRDSGRRRPGRPDRRPAQQCRRCRVHHRRPGHPRPADAVDH